MILEKKKKKFDDNINEKFEISNTISTLIANSENAELRKKVIKEEIDNNISELDSSRLSKSEILQNLLK